MYHVRDVIHRCACKHKGFCAIEEMFVSVLEKAKNSFINDISDPDRFIKLDDSIKLKILLSV
jgi:hypothetical protein